jgi:hypothetical protein
MKDMNRRAALGFLFGGAAVAASVALLPSEAEALTLPKLDDLPETQVEDAQYIVIGRPRRRRRRHRVCYRNRWGRRVCRW